MSNGMFEYNSSSCSEFIDFLYDSGIKELSYEELINAYVNNLYGVTQQNFLDAGMLPPLEQ